MSASHYRSTLDAFLRETEWQISPAERPSLQIAFDYMNRNVPAALLDASLPSHFPGEPHRKYAHRPSHGRFTKMMSWLQAIDLEKPVNASAFVQANALLVAFRMPDDPPHQAGRFYVRLVETWTEQQVWKRLGIPSTQNQATFQRAKHAFTCLESTAGDAFLAWVDPKSYADSYAHGGRRQLFIWNPEARLEAVSGGVLSTR